MHPLRAIQAAALTASLAVLLTGCGSRQASHTLSGVVLRADVVGGHGPGAGFTTLPGLVVSADGAAIIPGAVFAIYPGAAMPSLLVGQLAPADLQQLVDNARGAGLADPKTDFGRLPAGDQSHVVVTLSADGRSVSVDIPGATVASTVLTPAQASARKRVFDLLDSVATRVPVGNAHPYRPASVAVMSRTIDSVRAQAPPVEWPGLSTPVDWPLASMPASDSCAVYDGSDAAKVLAAAASATELTTWGHGGRVVGAYFRPLTPGDRGCAVA